jgi:hypothetical protein
MTRKTTYRGFAIYHRRLGLYDVYAPNGVFVGYRATLARAMKMIDAYIERIK